MNYAGVEFIGTQETIILKNINIVYFFIIMVNIIFHITVKIKHKLVYFTNNLLLLGMIRVPEKGYFGKGVYKRQKERVLIFINCFICLLLQQIFIDCVYSTTIFIGKSFLD